MKYFNTVFSGAMLPTGIGIGPVKELSILEVTKWIREGEVMNIANPTHANTLAAVSQVVGVDLTSGATGRKVTLQAGDSCLVAEFENSAKLPRETRQFTDAEIAAAGPLRFRLYPVFGADLFVSCKSAIKEARQYVGPYYQEALEELDQLL